MSTSQESLSKDSSGNSAETPSPGVFDRLQSGESLEGWRNSPVTSATTTAPADSPAVRNSTELSSAASPCSDFNPNSPTVQSIPDIPVPKLNLSALTGIKEPDPSPSPVLTSPIPRISAGKSLLSDQEESNTAFSTICNTPGTSPEPELAKFIR